MLGLIQPFSYISLAREGGRLQSRALVVSREKMERKRLELRGDFHAQRPHPWIVRRRHRVFEEVGGLPDHHAGHPPERQEGEEAGQRRLLGNRRSLRSAARRTTLDQIGDLVGRALHMPNNVLAYQGQ